MPTIDLGGNALTQTNIVPQLKKPPYLITLDEGLMGKTRNFQRFISLDKPESLNGFIQVKGIFCDRSEEEIIKNFNDILTSSPKELTLEMMFPLHRIYSIRSLVFNAVKMLTNAPVGKHE